MKPPPVRHSPALRTPGRPQSYRTRRQPDYSPVQAVRARTRGRADARRARTRRRLRTCTPGAAAVLEFGSLRRSVWAGIWGPDRGRGRRAFGPEGSGVGPGLGSGVLRGSRARQRWGFRVGRGSGDLGGSAPRQRRVPCLSRKAAARPPSPSPTEANRVASMSYMLPHLHNGWQVDQAILSEEDRVVVIRFGHDWDPTCMKMDEVLYSIAEKVPQPCCRGAAVARCLLSLALPVGRKISK